MKRIRRGTTLIELIAALVILSLLAAVAGLGLVEVTEGYVFAKLNAQATEKGQVAISRLVKELTEIKSNNITSGTSTTLTYLICSGASHTVSLSGNNLLFDGSILTDRVNSFALTYQADITSAATSTYTAGVSTIINISLGITAAENQSFVFTNRVILRNYNCGGYR
ncbi:MAG: prepilin-type N-terminal cleavage/methylation domain-containing protein [Thermodesulfobacteriota bacterium]